MRLLKATRDHAARKKIVETKKDDYFKGRDGDQLRRWEENKITSY